MQAAGYATAHFGKWHMGGGRDVDDAPLPQAYGFDESLVSFEGLGDRIISNPNHCISTICVDEPVMPTKAIGCESKHTDKVCVALDTVGGTNPE